jgi:hypothetical protein
MARNLKFILLLFEQMSGLKINFHKSEVICLGDAIALKDSFVEIFTHPYADLPLKYLGICHTRVLGVQSPGANIITRCAGTKSHTYDESWHRIECHIFTI